MRHYRNNRGPIQLYPLPGAEEYVEDVAYWLSKHFLKDIKEHNTESGNLLVEIADFFSMDKKEVVKLEKVYNNEAELEKFIANFLTGGLNYFFHKNGAIEVALSSSARRKDIYLFHTFSETTITDYNGVTKTLSLSDQELLLYNTLDAFLEAKTDKVSIFELNLGQARSDKPKGRGSCNLRTFFRNITANGADHFLLYQIHSAKSLIGLDIRKTQYDNLRGESLLKKYILRNYVKTTDFYDNTVLNDWIFSSVDAGGKAFAGSFARSFKVPLMVVDKRRDTLTNKIEEVTILKPESISVEGKTVFIVDDMIDSGGSIMDVCRKYKELGAKEINVGVVYGLFSSPAEERLQQLRSEGALNRVVVTDLIKHDQDFLDRNPYIDVAGTTYTTARIIQKTNMGRSLEKYFITLDARDYIKEKVEVESK